LADFGTSLVGPGPVTPLAELHRVPVIQHPPRAAISDLPPVISVFRITFQPPLPIFSEIVYAPLGRSVIRPVVHSIFTRPRLIPFVALCFDLAMLPTIRPS
jgi:hypothetical protein